MVLRVAKLKERNNRYIPRYPCNNFAHKKLYLLHDFPSHVLIQFVLQFNIDIISICRTTKLMKLTPESKWNKHHPILEFDKES